MFRLPLFLLCLNFELLLSQKVFEVFKKCKINDKICIKESIENGLPKLVNGSKEFDFPPLDPYFFGNSSIEVDGLLQEYTNLTFFGYRNVNINNIEFDLEACQIKFDFGLPNTVYENTFHWKGIIDGNEINIVSIMRMPCANSKSVNVFNCKIVKKDDVEYLEIVDGTTDFHFGDVGFEISHFSKDNIEPNSNFNEYVNKHSQTEIPLIEQMANKNIGWLVRFLSNKIFSKIPLSELFLN